jgi:hypothetical protein
MNSNISESNEKNEELADNNSRKSQGKLTYLAEWLKVTCKGDEKLQYKMGQFNVSYDC